MIKISWNTSSKHCGSKMSFEKPDRIEFCIDGLIEKFNPDIFIKPIDNFVSSALYVESLDLVNSIHSQDYVERIKNYKAKQFKCRKCENTTKCLELMSFLNFIEFKKSCWFCSNPLSLDNIYCWVSIDTYLTPYTFEIALEAVGTIKKLLDWMSLAPQSNKYTFALVRPPGHHCANDPNGFCIFNNVFAGAKYAQTLGYKKVLILDVDFHHGDGTESLILNSSEPNISFVSVHGFGENIYPRTGKFSNQEKNILNIPLEITLETESRLYVTDEYYQNIIVEQVFPFVNSQNPDLIIVSLGFDAHRDDPLEGLNISDSTYLFLVDKLKESDKPVMFVTEGGYNVKTIRRLIPMMIEKIYE